MWTDLLNKFKEAVAKKPEAQPDDAAPKPGLSAKQELEAEKSSRANQDRIVFAVIAVVVIGGYFLFQSMRTYEEPFGESLIPLAQLTGKVGVQPRHETPEQQFRRENRNVPLSDGSSIPEEIVNERTRLFHQVPFGDNELTYELRLPASWGQSKFAEYGTPPGSEKYKVLTNIDRYFGPSIEDSRPYVWLEVERLDRLTLSSHYRDLFFIKRGITPESVKTYNDHESEALYVDVRDYRTYAVRSKFVTNGDRVMVLSFGVPLTDYAHYKDIMGLTLSSFRMLEEIKRQPEPLEQYKLLNILSFDYLPRWLIRNENRTSSLTPSVEFILPTELNLVGTQLLKGQQIEGLILVHAWRNRAGFDRQILEQTIVKRLGVGGVKLREILQPETDMPPRDDITKITQAIYIGVIDQSETTKEEFGVVKDDKSYPRQEVWVTIFDNGDYTAAVTLVTWPQTKNYVQWSHNVIAYKAILNSLTMRKLVF